MIRIPMEKVGERIGSGVTRNGQGYTVGLSTGVRVPVCGEGKEGSRFFSRV